MHDYLDGDKIVCTFRDFRDSVISRWRTNNINNIKRKITKKEIIDEYKKFKIHYESLMIYKNKCYKKSIFLKYEEFFNNYDVIYDSLENFFDIKIQKDKREQLTEYSSFSKNMERSKKFNNFGEWDSDGIHGLHLYKGETGYWIKFVKEEDREYFNNILYPYLKEWNYEL